MKQLVLLVLLVLLGGRTARCQPMTILDPNVPYEVDSSGPFAPTSLSGLVMWMSVTNGVTNNASVTPPANNDTVKGWADLSGNNNSLIKLGGTGVQPIYHTTGGGSNNSPMISFTVSTAQSLTNSMNGTTMAMPNTFFFYGAISGNSANGALLNGQADQNEQIQVNLGAPQPVGLFDNGVSQSANLNSTAIQRPAFAVWTIKFNGASSTVRTNGVTVANLGSASWTVGQKGITLGNYFNSGICIGMDLCEFLWYSGNDLSTTQMHQVETYLANKYGNAIF